MKKTLLTILFLCLFGSFTQAFAAPFPTGSASVHVQASIGQYYINLSGYIAPFASVVMTVDGVVYKSVVADSTGHFTIPQILVRQGFDHFCLDSIDAKRLGESEACLTIPAMRANYTRSDIFLPPTIGLFRKQVNVGENATIWGYTMPGAVARVKFPDGTIYTVTADATGYYEIHPKLDKAGSFELFADATLNGKQSENPVKGVILQALSLGQQVGQTVTSWWKNLLTFLFNLPLGPLWAAIPILILIFILLKKLKDRGAEVPGVKVHHKFTFDLFKKNKKLHHWWIRGVGY